MKIEISPEAFNALVQEYEKHMELYDQVCSLNDSTHYDPDYDGVDTSEAFFALFETIGMVIAEVIEEGLDDWCEQNRSVMEAALRENLPMKEAA